MPDVLLQTLRAAADVAFALTEITPTCDAVQGTVATLQDGSDDTGSRLTASNDLLENANGTYREEWLLDPVALAIASLPISFLRHVTRTKRTDAGPAGAYIATYQPSIAGTVRGALHHVGAVASDAQDFVTDPADGLTWTAAKVAAQRFGWFLVAGVTSEPLALDQFVACWAVDFRVELWGPLPPPSPLRESRPGPYAQEIIADAAAYWGGRRGR